MRDGHEWDTIDISWAREWDRLTLTHGMGRMVTVDKLFYIAWDYLLDNFPHLL